MLFDEAIYALVEMLEREPSSTLQIHAQHGEYFASLEVNYTTVVGDIHPVLSDALASLVERVRGQVDG